MSHIFDALQRSETERAGTELPAPASVTELLMRAELHAASSSIPDEPLEDSLRRESGLGNLPSALNGHLGEGTEPAPLAGAESRQVRNRSEILSQFHSLRVSLSAQSRLVCLTEKDSPAAEAFRLLGVRLRHLRRDRRLQKLLITSAAPQEGKSFAAANLACTIATGTERRVLLVDGDLRRPSLSQLFGLGPLPGVSEWLQGNRRMTACIHYLDPPGVWFLPAGKTPGNPLELIQSPKLPSLMDELTTWFDWIVIDSPPVLPLADTSVWARLADAALLITRQGFTEKRKLQRALEALEPNKLIGALLNSFTGAVEKDYYYYRHEPVLSHSGDDSTE